MSKWVMLSVIMLAALAQAVLPGTPWLGHAKVPALMAVVVYYALARDRSDWLAAAILAGLVQDGMGLMPFGYSSFAFCVMALMVARFKDLVFVHETVTHMLFGLLTAAGVTFILYLLLRTGGGLEMGFGSALHKVMGTALLGAVVTPVIFMGCAHLDQLMGVVAPTDTSWHDLR